MAKIFLYYSLFFLLLSSLISCQSNSQKSSQFQDSLIATLSSDSSILVYTEGLEKLKDALEILESPVYTKGDNSFYTIVYKKDSLPVLYVEINDAGEYGSSEKKYYLENGELVFFVEKLKQISEEVKNSYSYKESRIYFRNAVFLKAEERTAKNEIELQNQPFYAVDEQFIDKNTQVNVEQFNNAINGLGDFDLTFDRLDSLSATKYHLVMSNNKVNTYQSVYQVFKTDSLILDIKSNPSFYKGKKLKVKHIKKGSKMIYQDAQLATF
jgi:hypothetical protein